MPETIPDAIEQAALGPKSVQVGTQSVQQQTIDDLIKADQYINGATAAALPGFGLRFQKIIPPGGG